MIVKFFEVLGVFTLLIFLPHIVFSCKPKPCIFGDDDPGPNNDIFIARRISSLGSSKYKIYLKFIPSIHFSNHSEK